MHTRTHTRGFIFGTGGDSGDRGLSYTFVYIRFTSPGISVSFIAQLPVGSTIIYIGYSVFQITARDYCPSTTK